MSIPRTSAARIKLSQLRHSLVHEMIALIDVNAKHYNQNQFPNPDSGTAVCSTPYCAAGFLIQAKDQELFDTLCKFEARGENINWEVEAEAVLKLDKYPLRDTDGLGFSQSNLFGGVSFWPFKFADAYSKAKGPRGRFKAMKALWAEFLKRSDAELGVVTAR